MIMILEIFPDIWDVDHVTLIEHGIALRGRKGLGIRIGSGASLMSGLRVQRL